MNDSRLISLAEAAEILGVDKMSLRRTPDDVLQSYRTTGGHRRYRKDDVLKKIGQVIGEKKDIAVIYNCVSSQDQKQKGDLDRQKLRNIEWCIAKKIEILETFEECSSGMNDNRPKLKKIIKMAGEGKFTKLVVEHKDRLARFNTRMFEFFFAQMGVEVVYVEEILPKSFENELVEDMLGLLSSFSAKIYGRRSKQNKERSANLESSAQNQIDSEQRASDTP